MVQHVADCGVAPIPVVTIPLLLSSNSPYSTCPPPHSHEYTSSPPATFNICCPRDCVSRHNGGTSGAPLKPLRDDSALCNC